jgi:hypothetical protein
MPRIAALAPFLPVYALPMTIGRGSSLPSTMALLLAAVLGVGLFVLAYARAGESSMTFV